MNAEVFIDTNVFLYSLSDHREEQSKAERARQLLLNDNWGWSVQVAGEFYSTATSPKRQFQLSPSLATEYIETWLNFPTASVSAPTVRAAPQLSAKFQINYWDAAIIAAARELDCHTVYSEDLADRQELRRRCRGESFFAVF